MILEQELSLNSDILCRLTEGACIDQRSLSPTLARALQRKESLNSSNKRKFDEIVLD
jgi:hypothetical protein